MWSVETLLLVGGILLVASIAASKLATRFGIPVLVLFLLVGMFAGSEGLGGIPFEDYHFANALGTIALVIILFDGGLRTPPDSLRSAGWPALSLATVGVVVTAAVVGLVAVALLHLRLLEGLLLGSIVGSTDAAAVFAVLRQRGVSLRPRLAGTLEIESGINDPMAVFLTLGLLAVLVGERTLGVGLVWLFVREMAIGAVIGIAVAYGTGVLLNRINLGTAGLYPVLAGGSALLTYGLAASLGGSGFLAVYLAGLVLGSRRVVYQRGILLFHDGFAWLCQIAMFIMLGLLCFPSRLGHVAGQGLLITGVLIFLARPLAVAIALFPFRFSVRELAFVAWVGLRGAVPIILATFPPMVGFPRGEVLFDVVFFVVLVSALVQGWALPFVASWLGVQVPPPPTSSEVAGSAGAPIDHG
jgi:cell volume regulation protein A